MPEVVPVDDDQLAVAASRAAGVLQHGGLVVAPAGPMYGLFADVSQSAATARVFAARGADRTSPLPVVVHNPRHLPKYVDHLPEEAQRLMAAYWPGPLTLVLRLADTVEWDLGDCQDHLTVRMPAEPLALMMIGKVGPLGCAAAAAPGADPPITVDQAREQLGDQVDLYLDGGPRTGQRTTVVHIVDQQVNVLREGTVATQHVDLVAHGRLPPGERPVGEPAQAVAVEPESPPD